MRNEAHRFSYPIVVGYNKDRQSVKLKALSLTIPAVELLALGGYKDRKEKGWVRNFAPGHRFHVYVVEGGIHMHTDETKVDEDGSYYHKSSMFQCRDEKKRLRKLMPESPKKNYRQTIILEQSTMAEEVKKVAQMNALSLSGDSLDMVT